MTAPIRTYNVLPAGWKARALRGLAALKPRIDALKGRVYNGFGFHEEMVREAEYLERLIPKVHEVITFAWSEDERRIQTAESIIAEVRYDALVRDVAGAENSADEWDREHPNWGRRQAA